jgi:hypothetical protein
MDDEGAEQGDADGEGRDDDGVVETVLGAVELLTTTGRQPTLGRTASACSRFTRRLDGTVDYL